MSASASRSTRHSPHMRLLSNGSLSTLVSDTGCGFLQWQDRAISRWRPDSVREDWGSYIFVRDIEDDVVFAPTPRPVPHDDVASSFHDAPGSAVFACRRGDLEVELTIAVAPDFDAEIRRVSLVNHGDRPRSVELTSYAELVLGPAAADAAHPAFSKMFVQTEFLADASALLATRRPRDEDEKRVWALHFTTSNTAVRNAQFETDRARFLGRGRPLARAQALESGETLSNTAGCVLDPVFSLRRELHIGPGKRATITFWTLAAGSREALLRAHQEIDGSDSGDEVIAVARKHAKKRLADADLDEQAQATQTLLLAVLLVANPAWRASEQEIARGKGGSPTLWAAGISGDRPIMLVDAESPSALPRIERLLRMQTDWQRQWVGIDVVILNHATGGDGDALQERLEALAKAQQTRLGKGDAAKAEVFTLRADATETGLRDGLRTAARVVLDAEQDDWQPRPCDVAANDHFDLPKPVRASEPHIAKTDASPALSFENGYGGFACESREYVITLEADRLTPQPWINVIANPDFGFLVSAEGGGYTWSDNSQQNPLTPWPNDPVSDTPSDIMYLRDTDSGDLWSATALPIRVPAATYRIRHGKGYSVFTHEAHGIAVELLMCVPIDDPVKLSWLRIVNRSGRTRHLSVTAYVEWALSAIGANGGPTITTWLDEASGAIFARNAWRAEFGERVAFLDLGGMQHCATADRDEFLGTAGIEQPAALTRSNAPLSGRTGTGIPSCGALQTRIELGLDAAINIRCMLGEAGSEDAAQALIGKYRDTNIDAVLQPVHAQWHDLLECVQVRTPDPALDVLLNDWLLYQVLACRVWARTAYYQASGAFGFRDQLQDVMALCVARPDLAREQILRSGGRQFVEGDVQHWWLPPDGEGIRTRMSDDRLWLPFVAAHYIAVTGDDAILAELLPFLAGKPLEDGQNDAFFKPDIADESASLYEHCARAIDVSLTKGPHGLPLIGTGDWNDGMNRVGIQGRGESVWLAWFVLASIDAMLPHAHAQNDDPRISAWTTYQGEVREALEAHGWDGNWFRRGYYDDGAPLGSASSEECRIDTIAQSWSVISAPEVPAPGSRPVKAMDAVHDQLVWRDAGVAPLLTPPFDHGSHDPGYIRGYPPGIRENGGQYTHGSIWGIFAFARLGDGDRAGELFSILNPVRHADSAEAIARYRVEPYVSCADVYSVEPHVGRGGWTWYSGSAGWLYRAGLEALLGFHVRRGTLTMDPCIPKGWPRFDISYQHRAEDGTITYHEIAVDNPKCVNRGIASAHFDGEALANGASEIPLAGDGKRHCITIVLG